MTNEGAKEVLFDMLGDSILVESTKQNKAIIMAIKALEQEPCGDAISRQEVLDEINRIGIKAFETYNDYSQFFDFVDTLPPVTPQPKMGYWIDGEKTRWKCSRCGYGVLDWNTTPYCPNCGAKMVELQESEDEK